MPPEMTPTARTAACAALRSAFDGRAIDPAWVPSLREALRDDAEGPAFRALLLGLPSEEETAQALGIAGTHAAGVRETFGTNGKALHAGHAAASGLRAAQTEGGSDGNQ